MRGRGAERSGPWDNDGLSLALGGGDTGLPRGGAGETIGNGDIITITISY